MIVISGAWDYSRLCLSTLQIVVMLEYCKMNMNYFCNQKNKIEIKKTKQNSFVIIFLKETEKCGEGTIK